MKKKSKNSLIYDESTKIIKVKTRSKNKMHAFLERNKIYFETIMMFVVSIVGVIVSMVGIKVAMVANDISIEERRINDLENQPAFVLEKRIDGNLEKYIIRNIGGDIKYGNVLGRKVIEIVVYSNEYDYLGKGCIILDGYWEKGFATYDFDNNNFELSTKFKSKPVMGLMERVENVLIDGHYLYGLVYTEYFDFMYKDYKQTMNNKSMLVQGGMLSDIENSYSFMISVDLNDIDDEKLDEELQEQLSILEKCNSR